MSSLEGARRESRDSIFQGVFSAIPVSEALRAEEYDANQAPVSEWGKSDDRLGIETMCAFSVGLPVRMS